MTHAKHYIQFIIFFSILFSYGQDFSGEVGYVYKQNIKMKLDSTKYDNETRNKISEFFTSQFEAEYELSFNNHKSLFRKKPKLSMKGESIINNLDALFKDIKERKYTHQIELYGKQFLIKDSLASNNWRLTSDKKAIGDFVCYKAIAIDSSNTETIAWYTTEIPISIGPDKYWGLPGLILEVITNEVHFACNSLKLKPKTVKAPRKGKVVNQRTFDSIKQKKELEKEQQYEFYKGIEEGKN